MMDLVRRLRLQLFKDLLRLCFSCRRAHGAVVDSMSSTPADCERFRAGEKDDNNRSSQQRRPDYYSYRSD